MSTPLTAEELLELIASSTRKITVCTPSREWERRGGDWVEEEIEYIAPDKLEYELQRLIDERAGP